MHRHYLILIVACLITFTPCRPMEPLPSKLPELQISDHDININPKKIVKQSQADSVPLNNPITYQIAFNPNAEKKELAMGQCKKVVLCHYESDKRQIIPTVCDQIYGMEYRADGKELVYAGHDQIMITNLEHLSSALYQCDSKNCFYYDSRIITCLTDGNIYLWDTENNRFLKIAEPDEKMDNEKISHVDFHKNNNLIAYTVNDKFSLYSVFHGMLLYTLVNLTKDNFHVLKFCRDGSKLLTAIIPENPAETVNINVKSWDLDNGKVDRSFKIDHRAYALGLAYLDDHRFAAKELNIVTGAAKISLFDYREPKQITSIEQTPNNSSALCYNGADSLLAAGSSAGIEMYDIRMTNKKPASIPQKSLD